MRHGCLGWTYLHLLLDFCIGRGEVGPQLIQSDGSLVDQERRGVIQRIWRGGCRPMVRLELESEKLRE